MKQRTRKKQAHPNRWATEEWWRCPLPGDKRRARRLRRALGRLRIYPRCDLAQKPHLAGWEANCRAALPAMVAELDRTGLVAVTEVVRLLVVTRF